MDIACGCGARISLPRIRSCHAQAASAVRWAMARWLGGLLALGFISAMTAGIPGTSSWAGGGMQYYVAPNGSDANDGSESHPFATIDRGAEVVNPGDTVIVRDGIYTDLDEEGTMVRVRRSGTPEAPITFRAEHKWRAVLDGQNNKGEYAWSLWHEKELCHVNIEGFEIRSFASHGFSLQSNTHHILIKGNHVHHIGNIETTTHYGLDGSYDSESCSYITYDGNVIHDIGRIGPPTVNFNLDHGIYTCGDHNVIANNVFYDNKAGWGVQVAGYDTVDDLVISNNTFAGGESRGHIVLWQPCHNLVIQNNIFYRPAVPNAINFYEADLQNVIIRHNLVFGGGLKDNDDNGACLVSDTIEGRDPLFVDPAQSDFRLQAGSPAIDAGVAVKAPDHDCAGKRRPYGAGVDLGAFEWHPAKR